MVVAKQISTVICIFFMVSLFALAIPNESIAADHDFDILKGEWIRPDGGYVLKINEINEDGFVGAEYLNPKPIRIKNARISRWKEYLKLVVQFNDTGYKGSNYKLFYYKEKDALAGFYYQAQMDQTFKVVFVRKSDFLKNNNQ